jgi:hypothetical protein
MKYFLEQMGDALHIEPIKPNSHIRWLLLSMHTFCENGKIEEIIFSKE